MKLTLNIESSLTNQYKEVAKNKNTSILTIVRSLLKNAFKSEIYPFRMKSESELPDWIKELTIAGEPVSHFDHHAEYQKHLEEKYIL
jgi:hypothetical protein